MLVLNECRISEDGKCLIVEASVDSLDYYRNVYISHIIIDTDKTWIPGGPSSNHIYIQDFTTDSESGKKNVRLSINVKDLNLSTLNDNIFIIYFVASGYPAPDTPCGMDNSFIIGVAYNTRNIYNNAINYIKELNNSCEIPKGFIDSFLKFKAFKLALSTGNFPEAFKMWEYIGKSKNTISKGGCRCHGT